MIYNLAVLLVIFAFGAVWSSKSKGYGLFSALLALVCTIAAGAIAFGLWEPLTYGVLLKQVKPGTFLGGLIEDTAFGVGLLVPFAVSLLVLRLVVDKIVSRNMRFGETLNFAGGALFGAANGFIVIGIITVGLGYMRIGPSMLGYAAIDDSETGSPVRSGNLWVPADRLTVDLYEALSVGSFGTGTPLAVYQPDADEQGAMLRTNYKGASRVTMLPDHFEVKGRYTVEGPLNELLADQNLEKAQTVRYADGSEPQEGARIEGVVIQFSAEAKEKGGSVSVSPSQLRMLVGQGENARGIHPFAVIAQPDAGAAGMYRFRFNSEGAVISSVGGKSTSLFAFEFLVPPGAEVQDLLVKNIRADYESAPAYQDGQAISARMRDENINDGDLFAAFGVEVGGSLEGFDLVQAEGIAPEANGNYPGVQVSSRVGVIFEKIKVRSWIRTTGERNEIVSAEGEFPTDVVAGGGLDQKLRVDSYAVPRGDVRLVQIEIARDNAESTYGRALEFAGRLGRPVLATHSGATFDAIGYFYQDNDQIKIRYTPDRPIRSMTEVPNLSAITPDQTLKLLFLVDRDSRLQAVKFGDDPKSQRKFDGQGPEVK